MMIEQVILASLVTIFIGVYSLNIYRNLERDKSVTDILKTQMAKEMPINIQYSRQYLGSIDMQMDDLRKKFDELLLIVRAKDMVASTPEPIKEDFMSETSKPIKRERVKKRESEKKEEMPVEPEPEALPVDKDIEEEIQL